MSKDIWKIPSENKIFPMVVINILKRLQERFFIFTLKGTHILKFGGDIGVDILPLEDSLKGRLEAKKPMRKVLE